MLERSKPGNLSPLRAKFFSHRLCQQELCNHWPYLYRLCGRQGTHTLPEGPGLLEWGDKGQDGGQLACRQAGEEERRDRSNAARTG